MSSTLHQVVDDGERVENVVHLRDITETSLGELVRSHVRDVLIAK
jgi:hypothetical protein